MRAQRTGGRELFANITGLWAVRENLLLVLVVEDPRKRLHGLRAVQPLPARARVPHRCGLFKGAGFSNLSEASSRVYRRRCLQLQANFAAFFKLYEIISEDSTSDSFQTFTNVQGFSTVFFFT